MTFTSLLDPRSELAKSVLNDRYFVISSGTEDEAGAVRTQIHNTAEQIPFRAEKKQNPKNKWLPSKPRFGLSNSKSQDCNLCLRYRVCLIVLNERMQHLEYMASVVERLSENEAREMIYRTPIAKNAIHRRILTTLYGYFRFGLGFLHGNVLEDKVEELFEAISTHPKSGITVLCQRLRQQLKEWYGCNFER